VLDKKTGFPVWYSIIPGNILDLSTLQSTMEDVAESLDIRIDDFVLDADYASREFIQGFHSDNEWGKTMTVRMPAKKGYPHKSLYLQTKKLMGKTQSLMCTKKRDGAVLVEVPNKQVKEFYHKMKVKVPPSVDLDTFKKEILQLKTEGS